MMDGKKTMQPEDSKAEILKQIIALMEQTMMSGLKKPGEVEKPAESMSMTIEAGPEEAVEGEEDLNDDDAQSLLRMYQEEDEGKDDE
jgi:hypothetical protein